MKLQYLIAVLAAFPLVGCGQSPDALGRSAESVRTATEQMATQSRAKSNAREAKILADGIQIEERERAADPDAEPVPPRYEVRRDGAGWSVYDVNTGRVARKGALPQNGLTRSGAEQAAWDMQLDENEARYRQALTNAVR